MQTQQIRPMRRWLPLIILAAAQFVMVLDSSVMNVSISQIVADLDTTVRACRARSPRTRW
jgi:predicted MFS family arabinose efflux permease